MTLFYVQKPQNPIDAIEFFISEASKVDEFDYGDCMREWNRELLFFRDVLHEQQRKYNLEISPWVFQKIDAMQMYIQFAPNWDVESTKKRILEDSHQLRDHFILSENAGRAA